jgi:hypothetical protein
MGCRDSILNIQKTICLKNIARELKAKAYIYNTLINTQTIR